MLKNRYYAFKPEDSNGYAYVRDREEYDNEICTSYWKGIERAKRIAKALNLLNRKEQKK